MLMEGVYGGDALHCIDGGGLYIYVKEERYLRIDL